MRVGEVCSRNVIIVKSDASVVEVAKLMRQNAVGDVVVVESRNQQQIPVGIITALLGGPFFIWLLLSSPFTKSIHR